MSTEEDKLLEIAARVSDGAPVDWELEEENAEGKLREKIRQLRLVGEISEVYRSSVDDRSSATPESMAATVASDEFVADDDDEHEMPKRWGHLEIREQLGEGGFGEVYRAWDANLDREVALKLLKRGSRARAKTALAEGKMLARVRHPNVITVHGAETHDGRVGVWMELVQGRTLGRLVREQGRFNAREAALLVIEISRALAAVHGSGLVHRDIKADNAMRDQDGRLVLMDFGAGVELDKLGSGARGISGTPLYIAPEIFDGGSATRASDIYSMGVLLYHLVTGSYPVRGRSVAELKQLHRQRKMRLLRDERPELPEAFVQVVERALAQDPQQRFETAGQLEQALVASLGLDSSSLSVSVPSPSAPTPATQSRASLWGVAAALGLVAVVVLAVWSLQGRRDSAADAAASPRPSAGINSSADAYTVQALLFRLRDGQRERLARGDRLEIGDQLSLELQASKPLHVYIFNEDAKGNAYALFPLPDFELQNPLPAETLHVLPGRRNGQWVRWQVSSAGGTEHLIVLASPEPLADFEEELARLARPDPNAIAMAVPPQAKERLRGIGSLAVSAEPNRPQGSSANLFDMARRLAGEAERVEGIWMREIELTNPE